MGITNQDFLLTDEQLDRINRYFEESAKAYVAEGECQAMSASATFEFTAPLGRFVTAYYDNSVKGYPIEDPLEM